MAVTKTFFGKEGGLESATNPVACSDQPTVYDIESLWPQS